MGIQSFILWLALATISVANNIEIPAEVAGTLQDQSILQSEKSEADTGSQKDKRGTSTTFCVEIRPSDPYQKPFQVCEPSYAPKYDPKPPVKYGAPSFVNHAGLGSFGKNMFVEQPVQPQVIHAPVAHYVPADPHMSYRTILDDEDDDDDDEVEAAPRAEGRTAYKKKYKKKYKSHGGLVISCEPSAVGYLKDPPQYVMPYGGYGGGIGHGGHGFGGHGFGGHLGYRSAGYGAEKGPFGAPGGGFGGPGVQGFGGPSVPIATINGAGEYYIL